MGKEVYVLPRAITLYSRVMVIEVVVFVFEFVGSLVGTLSGHCPVHQLAPQFGLRLCRSFVSTLSGLYPVLQHVIMAPQFVI